MNISKLAESINTIVDYNWADEENDYLQTVGEYDVSDPDSMDQSHVFTSLVWLANFVETV